MYIELRKDLERQLLLALKKSGSPARIAELADTLIAAGSVDHAMLKTAGIVLFGNGALLAGIEPDPLDKIVQQIKLALNEEDSYNEAASSAMAAGRARQKPKR